MSDQADQQNSFAREIYLAFVSQAGPREWDWQKLANSAFDAADQFNTVSQQRITPQAGVPISVLFPGEIGAVDPAAAAAVPPAPDPVPPLPNPAVAAPVASTT